jgi:hypothetical protein
MRPEYVADKFIDDTHAKFGASRPMDAVAILAHHWN